MSEAAVSRSAPSAPTTSSRSLPLGGIAVVAAAVAVVVFRDQVADRFAGGEAREWMTVFIAVSVQALPFLVLGVVLWGGFNTAVEWTNREAFCIGCHEMRENVYKEYSENTIHYTNRTGVRATCPDCHVPKEWGPKMWRKVQASRELYGKAVGTIDTREKFEAKRLQLAESEWARMKANDSLECRNCHTLASMDPEKQKPRAKKSHELAKKNNETCIDCHKGIAHHKPKGMKEEE